MMVPPGFSTPDFSASSTMASAMRSLIEPPGLLRSDLIQTCASGPNRRLMRTCGVLPMVCRMLSAFMVSPVWGDGSGRYARCAVAILGQIGVLGGYMDMQ